MRIALKFGYYGVHFHGYQRQKNVLTVEGLILDYLKEKSLLAEPHRFASSSRTDAGVSALGNVIAFNTNEKVEKIIGMLNTLSDDIWFYGYAHVGEKFNPRRAKERWYRYILPAWMCTDIQKLKEALSLFSGTHDFRNFARPTEKKTVRKISQIEVRNDAGIYLIDIRGESFLWGMVRKIIGASLEYAKGGIEKNVLARALELKEIYDFPLARAEFLLLMDVKYDFEFTVPPVARKRLWRKIEKRFRTLAMENEIYRGLNALCGFPPPSAGQN